MEDKQAFIALVVVIMVVLASAGAALCMKGGGKDMEVVNDLMHVKGIEDDGVVSFKGIPYAEAPVGDLRFAAPVEKKPWTETLDCTKWGNIAIQSGIYKGERIIKHGDNESEDCLNLNIWAPADAKQGSDLPVYVWIHGGGFVQGSGQESTYDGTVFAKEGVIVVTINYRLGTLGFLALESLKDGTGTTGNWGTLDQICALKWVHNNIEKFGGDSNNVTVGGESAGSFSVLNMIVSPLTVGKGYFQKAILESGSVMHVLPASKSYDKTVEVSLNIAKKFDPTIQEDSEVVAAELREADPFKLMDACDFNAYMTTGDHSLVPWPANDGVVLPDDTLDAIKKGDYCDVKMIIGNNYCEGTLFTDPQVTENDFIKYIGSAFDTSLVEKVEQYYAKMTEMSISDKVADLTSMTMFKLGIDMVQNLFSEKCCVYGYEFFHWTADSMKPIHAIEISFAFGQNSSFGLEFDKNDMAIRDIMHGYWLNFIKTGDPNGKGLSVWTPYSLSSEVMSFGTDSSSMEFKLEMLTIKELSDLYFPSTG